MNFRKNERGELEKSRCSLDHKIDAVTIKPKSDVVKDFTFFATHGGVPAFRTQACQN